VAEWPEFDVVDLLRPLVGRGVDFVVIGGIAMVLHGSARVTRDLDICFAPDETNLELLGGVLVDLNARLRGVDEDVPFVPDGRTLRGIEILTLTTDAGWLDLQLAPSGAPAYGELRARADRVEVDGMGVLVASLDDLAAMKRAAGRPVDQIDLEEIEVIRSLRARRG
jgi:predicted nucleotidyltransferase